MERVVPKAPLTPMQFTVATLLGIGKSHGEIAELLHITVPNVRAHMRFAAAKLPGDLPRQTKLVAWVRGASLDVLEGIMLRGEMMRDAERGMIAERPEIVRRPRSHVSL